MFVSIFTKITAFYQHLGDDSIVLTCRWINHNPYNRPRYGQFLLILKFIDHFIYKLHTNLAKTLIKRLTLFIVSFSLCLLFRLTFSLFTALLKTRFCTISPRIYAFLREVPVFRDNGADLGPLKRPRLTTLWAWWLISIVFALEKQTHINNIQISLPRFKCKNKLAFPRSLVIKLFIFKSE